VAADENKLLIRDTTIENDLILRGRQSGKYFPPGGKKMSTRQLRLAG